MVHHGGMAIMGIGLLSQSSEDEMVKRFKSIDSILYINDNRNDNEWYIQSIYSRWNI